MPCTSQRGLADIDAELEELSLDAGSASQSRWASSFGGSAADFLRGGYVWACPHADAISSARSSESQLRCDRTRPRSIHLISLSRFRMDPHGPIRGLRPSGWDLRQGQLSGGRPLSPEPAPQRKRNPMCIREILAEFTEFRGKRFSTIRYKPFSAQSCAGFCHHLHRGGNSTHFRREVGYDLQASQCSQFRHPPARHQAIRCSA